MPTLLTPIDHAAIAELVNHVGAALDEGRFDDLRAVYTHDAVGTTPGGTAHGIDALVAQAARNHGPDHRIQHLISGVVAGPDPGRDGDVPVRANVLLSFAATDHALEWQAGGVYRFTARATDDGWRLSSVRTEPVWRTEDAPVPPAPPVP